MFHTGLNRPNLIVARYLSKNWDIVQPSALRCLSTSGATIKKEPKISNKVSFEQQIILDATKKWIDSIVIGEKLCPFVSPLQESDSIRFVASNAATVEQACYKFEVEAKLLLRGVEKNLKSNISEDADGLMVHESPVLHEKSNAHKATLIMFHGSFVTEFVDFDILCELVNHNVIIEKRFFDILSVMNFHPNYINFYDRKPPKVNDSFYYPKRSPYPTMLLVPEDEIQTAFQSSKIQELCDRNKMRFVQQGLKKCQSRLQACYDTDRNSKDVTN